MAKLHPISRYAYRIETNHTTDDEGEINAVFCNLSKNVAGVHRYGYPLGLMDADKYARVSRGYSSNLKPLLLSGINRDFAEKIELDVRSVDMHQNLDRIIYGGNRQ